MISENHLTWKKESTFKFLILEMHMSSAITRRKCRVMRYICAKVVTVNIMQCDFFAENCVHVPLTFIIYNNSVRGAEQSYSHSGDEDHNPREVNDLSKKTWKSL